MRRLTRITTTLKLADTRLQVKTRGLRSAARDLSRLLRSRREILRSSSKGKTIGSILSLVAPCPDSATKLVMPVSAVWLQRCNSPTSTTSTRPLIDQLRVSANILAVSLQDLPYHESTLLGKNEFNSVFQILLFLNLWSHI